MSINDSNPVASTDKYRCCADMNAAPMYKKLILINRDGVACFGKLTPDNFADWIEWCELPKRAAKIKIEE